MQTEQQGMNPYLAMILGSLTTLALFLIKELLRWFTRRRVQRRADAQVTSQLALKRIDIEVEQDHLKRDDLKAAEKLVDEWQDKYYTLLVEAKERELVLRLEVAQLKEALANHRARLKLYERTDENGGPETPP
jgi:hypothetical protein